MRSVVRVGIQLTTKGLFGVLFVSGETIWVVLARGGPWHGPIARLTRECELHAMQTARDHHHAVTLRENRAACLSLGDDSETRARASYK